MPLSATVTRGFTAVSGTPVDTDDLNAGFLPSVDIEGSVGSSDLGAGAVNSTHVVPGPIAYVATTGSANAYVAAPSPALTALTTGAWLLLKLSFTNTGAATLNVNSLGAKSLKKLADQDVEAGDLRSGDIVEVRYDGTNWLLAEPALPNRLYAELAGSVNAYTATVAGVTINANSDLVGRVLVLKVGAAITNTGASTLNVNGKGAVAIKNPAGSDVAAGDLTAARFVAVTFDGTSWQLLNSTTYTLPNVGPGAGSIAYPASITLDANGRVTAASAGTAPGGTVRALVVFDSTTGTSTAATVSSDGTAETVEVTAHGWNDGQLVWFDATTIGGTAANTPYYIESVDADNVKLHTTKAGAIAHLSGDTVNITSTGASVNTLRLWSSSPLAATPVNVDGVIKANSTNLCFVDFTTDLASAHYHVTGQSVAPAGGPLYAAHPNGTAPAAGGFWIGFSLPGTGYTTSTRHSVAVTL